jgi:AraC family transcriptional activator of mtrCDE
MDTLTRLVDLARLQGSLRLRCMFEGGFAVQEAQEPRGIVPFHVVLDGECIIETEKGARLKLSPGDFVMFPRGSAHWVRDREMRPFASPPVMAHDGMLPIRQSGARAEVDILCGSFTYAPGASALMQLLPDPLHVPLAAVDDMGSLRTLIALMRDEATSKQPGALAIITALSQALFTIALRSYGQLAQGTKGLLALNADKRLTAAAQAMLGEPAREWTLESLADISAMSRATFARHFKEQAGMTAMEFLSHVRMSIASEMLLHTRRTVADVGAEVGYRSEAAFSKAFQQSIGKTPSHYRRCHRQESG